MAPDNDDRMTIRSPFWLKWGAATPHVIGL
jgi:hypothetical protein